MFRKIEETLAKHGVKAPEMFRALFESDAAAMTFLNAEGRILLTNSQADALLGLPAGEAIQRRYNDPAWQMTSHDDRPLREEEYPFRVIQQTRQPLINSRIAIVWPEGRRKYLSASGVPVFQDDNQFMGAMFSLVDVTREVEAQKQAIHNRNLLNAVLQTAKAGICVSNRGGKIIMVNDAFCDISGYERVELLGQPLPMDLPASSGASAPQNQTAPPVAWKIRHKTGCELDVMISEAHLIQPGGTPLSVATVTDMTEQKRAERVQNQMARMESVSQLAAGIAHDFNNYLASIVMNLSVARMDEKTPASIQEVIETVTKVADNARHLTKQLLTFSKGGSPIKGPVPLKPMLEKARALTLRRAETRCDLQLGDDIWNAQADGGQLLQVFSNLLINATQAMSNAGRIWVSACNCRIDDREASPLPPGLYIRIQVRDSGPGIPEDIQSHIFEPYFTTKQTGTGLGLSTAYSIIRQHGGLLSYDSSYSEGAAFCIHLPASDTRAVEAPASPHVLESGHGHVLILEDDEDLQHILQIGLQRLGYQVTACSCGEDCLQCAQDALARGVILPAALLDLTIHGGMGGIQTLERLRKLFPEIKAIAMSGYSEQDAMAHPERFGFDEVLPKPFDIRTLSGVLSKVMAAS